MLPFDGLADKFDEKIKDICAAVWATEPPTLFMSYNKLIFNNDEVKKARKLKHLKKQIDKTDCEESKAKLEEEAKEFEPVKYKANFREDVAKKKVYKGNRKSDGKPLHFLNLVEYIKANYDYVIAKGLEADDLLGVYQTKAKPLTTIICSRDKDLKIIPGMHYSWESGYQREYGPLQVDEIGDLSLSKRNKLTGTGLKFFYSQVLTGDTTDNYPGLPRTGPVKAFNLLSDTNTEGEMFEAVLEAYREAYNKSHGEDHDYRAEMLEQARLAWMVCELTEEGEIVPYVMYDER